LHSRVGSRVSRHRSATGHTPTGVWGRAETHCLPAARRAAGPWGCHYSVSNRARPDHAGIWQNGCRSITTARPPSRDRRRLERYLGAHQWRPDYFGWADAGRSQGSTWSGWSES